MLDEELVVMPPSIFWDIKKFIAMKNRFLQIYELN
tara:strand:- start:12559 stop:12663 length:105 start_codon:yes stop_codon:yes gene_type:complete